MNTEEEQDTGPALMLFKELKSEVHRMGTNSGQRQPDSKFLGKI